MDKARLSRQIKQEAQRLGLMDCGIARARRLTEYEDVVAQWLARGMHGDMHYMARNLEKRLDPRELVPGARSVVVVLQNYYTPQEQARGAPRVCKYAYGRDYHDVLKKKLWQLADFIKEQTGSLNGRAFTDSAPVLERAWLKEAGLGWIGKNTNALTTSHGSYFVIGELIIDTELEYDTPTFRDYCGTCTKCIDACPTGAITQAGEVDSTKCISYLTIEYHGEFNEQTPDNFANYMFGCDVCQQVCPWNKKAQPHQESQFNPHPDLLSLTAPQWQELSVEQYREIFRKSAVKRTKYNGLMRNINYLYGKSENDE